MTEGGERRTGYAAMQKYAEKEHNARIVAAAERIAKPNPLSLIAKALEECESDWTGYTSMVSAKRFIERIRQILAEHGEGE